jgi:acetylornithine deacetylase
MSQSRARAVDNLDGDRLAELTMEVIDIPSLMGGESAVATYLHERFLRVGLKSRLQEVEDGRFNVIGRLEGNGTGPHLLYVGHMDTTWAGDEEGINALGPGYQPKSWRDGDWIYGMGAYNMKSGLTSMVHAVEAVAEANPSFGGDLIMAGVVGETSHAQSGRYRGARYRGTGVGARFLVTNGVTADLAVIAEPTNARLNIVSGGYLLFQVTTRGNPGATYRRGGADVEVKPAADAVANGVRIMQAIQEWAPGYMERTRYNGELATNVAVIAVEGGHPWRPTKYATFCRLYVEVQLMPGTRQVDVEVEFRKVLRELAEREPELRTEVEVIQNTPGAEVGEDEPLVRYLSAAHERVVGEPPPVVFDAWHADTTALTRYGIPTVCYGPAGRMRGGGAGYYAREGEMCYLPDLLAGSRVYVELAHDVCNRPRGEFGPLLVGQRGSVVV